MIKQFPKQPPRGGRIEQDTDRPNDGWYEPFRNADKFVRMGIDVEESPYQSIDPDLELEWQTLYGPDEDGDYFVKFNIRKEDMPPVGTYCLLRIEWGGDEAEEAEASQ